MKVRSPVLGYNHNVRYAGRLWHVQTEDSGAHNPHIFTHLFHDGTILATKRLDYDPVTEVAGVQKLMQTQHKSMLRELKDGAFDEKISKFLGEPISREGKRDTDPNNLPAMPTPEPLPLAMAATAQAIPTPPAGVEAQPAQPPRLIEAPPEGLREVAREAGAPDMEIRREPITDKTPIQQPARDTDPSMPTVGPPVGSQPELTPLRPSQSPSDRAAALRSPPPSVMPRPPGSPRPMPSVMPRPTTSPPRSSAPAPTSSRPNIPPPPARPSAPAARNPGMGIGGRRQTPAGTASAYGGSKPTAEGVVVARPAVIVGGDVTNTRRAPAPSSPRQPSSRWTSSSSRTPSPTPPPDKPGADNIFGGDLISEKSLDEVILAYLSEDLSDK